MLFFALLVGGLPAVVGAWVGFGLQKVLNNECQT